MSFGVVQSAIASMRYNRSLISKRTKFKITLVPKEREKIEFKTQNANYLELEILRRKMKKEHKRIKIEQITVCSLVILYFMFIGYMLLIR